MRSLLGVVRSLSPSKMLFAPAIKQSACRSIETLVGAAAKENSWSHWGSNPGPAACKADVITTTPCDHSQKSGIKLDFRRFIIIQVGVRGLVAISIINEGLAVG